MLLVLISGTVVKDQRGEAGGGGQSGDKVLIRGKVCLCHLYGFLLYYLPSSCSLFLQAFCCLTIVLAPFSQITVQESFPNENTTCSKIMFILEIFENIMYLKELKFTCEPSPQRQAVNILCFISCLFFSRVLLYFIIGPYCIAGLDSAFFFNSLMNLLYHTFSKFLMTSNVHCMMFHCWILFLIFCCYK